MADVEGLYIVTTVVLAGLFGWVLAVLVKAPRAIDESALSRAASSPSQAASASPAPDPAPAPRHEEPPPEVVAPPEPPLVVEAVESSAVAMPSSRPRLSSHQEIQDEHVAPIILMPGASSGGPKKEEA